MTPANFGDQESAAEEGAERIEPPGYPYRIDGIPPGGAEHDLQGHHEPRIARRACGVHDAGERDGVGGSGIQVREYPKTEKRPE